MRLNGRTALGATGLLAAASGIGLVLIRLLCEPTDEFSSARHPLELSLLRVHRWLAPATTLAIGWTIGDHASVRLGSGKAGRTTGLWVLAGLTFTLATSALLQTTDLGDWRNPAVWSHVGAATATVFGAAFHVRASRRECA